MKELVRKLVILLPVLLLLTLALYGCNKVPAAGAKNNVGAKPTLGASTTSNTVYMNSTNFTVHSVTVPASQPVTFSNTVNGGGLHIICVGTGTGGTNTCLQSGTAPAGLLGKGTTLSAGETKEFTFTPGTYHVICIVHPGMYINITAK